MNDHAIAHFVSGQVLGAQVLNDLVAYLEGQDRLSRRTLSGIGVVCGFDVDVDGATVHLSKGVAVTSDGYLIADEAQSFDRVRPYTLPLSDAEDATEAELAEERYPFFFDGDVQIPLQELVDTDYVPAPGEDTPDALTADMLTDRTVLLFLETALENLRSCDVNDCSDRGAERRFTLRRLLVTRAQADAILAQEADIAARPVDLHNHSGMELPYLRVEKEAIARLGISNYGALILRYVEIAQKLSAHLPGALRGAYEAYGYLVSDLFEDGAEPFPAGYFAPVWGGLVQNPFLAQYFYDYMRDAVMAYNEFVAAARAYEAECLPDPRRFPRHVLLGDAVAQPRAVTRDFPTPADVVAWNPLLADSGAGVPIRPAARRHHFVPSPAHAHHPRLDEVRALFLRLHLLALSFETRGLLDRPLRVILSRSGCAPLGLRAIPFYYLFAPHGALHRNWHPPSTRARLLSTVQSYQFSAPDDAHPGHFRHDGHDFIRIEGVIGKPLGTAMATLVAYKRALGLNFAIEPVFMPLAFDPNDTEGQDLDAETERAAAAAARELLLCRMSDFDIVFLVVIRAIFAFLVLLLQRLRDQPVRPGSSQAAGDGLTLNVSDTAARPTPVPLLDIAAASRFTLDLDPEEATALRSRADRLRADIVARPVTVHEVIAATGGAPAPDTAAALFARLGDPAGGGNLFDRTRAEIVQQGGTDADVQAAYQPVNLYSEAVGLMHTLSVDSLAEFDAAAFGEAYSGFARAYVSYADTARTTPVADEAAAANQARIVGSAGVVAEQTKAFAAANLQQELTAALGRIFGQLTLPGYARRHPGLAHHGGTYDHGTLVLGYCGRRAFERQAGRIRDAVAEPIRGAAPSDLTAETPTRDPAATFAASSARGTTAALDEFVVTTEFALPYRCCDSDCSDRVIGDRIRVDPFDPEVDPGPAGIDPVDPEPPTPPGGGGGGGIGPGGPLRPDFDGPDIFVDPGGTPVVERPTGPGGILWRPGTPVVSGGVRLPNLGLAQPVTPDLRGDGARDPRPDRPAEDVSGAGRALLRGIVAFEDDAAADPVPETEVIVTEAGARARSIATEDGRFAFAVRAGLLFVGAAAPEFQGRTLTLELEHGEERDIVLVVARRER